MTIQFTIIGLGQIGASIGLGLANQKMELTRVGHDKSSQIAREAQKLGVVDKVDFNLPSSVENADVVLLCVPASELKETLKYISKDLKENAVVMDFSPIKSTALEWAKEILPAKQYYAGITPGIDPDYLDLTETGITAARADLFRKGTFFINTPQGTPEAVTKLTTDLASLLGAKSVLVDTDEADSLIASIHVLPQLMAATLLNLTVDQSGWREARMIAGQIYSQNASALMEEESLGDASILNKKHTLRALDSLIASLQSLRAEIETDNKESLKKRFISARDGYARWRHERSQAEWRGDMPKQESLKVSDLLRQLLGGGLLKKKDDNEN